MCFTLKMKILSLLTIFLFFEALSRKVVWGFQWNSRTESWLTFHVRHCGRYCVESKLEIHNKYCETVEPCFQCDCDPNCSIYDTCCASLVNNSYVEPSFHTIHYLPNPDRFQCRRILYSSNDQAYYIISDCDPTYSSARNKVSDTALNIVRLCKLPNTRTLDDITPYSDIYYGIVFANKFCAMCNGYVINDSTTYDTYNLTVKIASPWTIGISCEHYQSLYHLTNEYKFFFAAANSSLCGTIFSPPPSKIPPKKCSERLDKNLKHVCTHQDSVEDQMCQTLPRRKYLQGDCLAASCTSGKIPSKEGRCTTALSDIRGLAYKLTLTLMPLDKVVMTESDIAELNTAMYEQLLSVSSRMNMDYEVTIVTLASGSDILVSNTIVAKILAGDKETRDEFEAKLIQILTRFSKSTSTSGKMSNMTLNFMLGTEHHTKEFRNSSLLSELSPRQYTKSMPEYIRYEVSHQRPWPDCCDFIDVTYTLLCPYVAVNISSVKVNLLDIHLSFNYDGRVIEVVGGPNISVVNGKLHICLKTFKMLIKGHKVQSSATVALYYFQIVGISLSVVCLVMSVVTYFLFSSLRTLPGLNNMCLCLSMLSAQVSLLLTVEFGLKGQLPPELCMFHAIFLHFSWLASFAWMSGCCIHMFLAFTSYTSRRNDVTSDLRGHIRFCVYGFGVPLLIVVANICLNAALTSGQSIGYDDTICFLDTRTSALTIVLTLLVPLCATVFSNGVLFTLTLREMLQIAKIQKAETGFGGQGVMTYVKLSTLTGIFCIVAAVAVWLDNIVLQFLTCPLMTLQGAFIFFSFKFNRRIGKMYYDLFGLHRLGIGLTNQSSSSQSASRKQKNNIKRTQQFTSSTNI
ncbi:G-protein coupled receptor 64 [Biomphalaria glabrata]|nr:G-protein coupled receptor 64 [Biomphalaria glabrata]